MSDKYILMEDGSTLKEEDLMAWTKTFETTNRTIALDKLDNDITVSTVFLGLDHGFGDGPPLLFETMVFVGDDTPDMDRYSTKEEAIEGHFKFVEAWRGKAYKDYCEDKLFEAREDFELAQKRLLEATEIADKAKEKIK